MSDGPYRSLPMMRHWKKVAKFAENYAFTDSECAEILRYALKKDFRNVILKNIQNVLYKGLPFKELMIEDLESIRKSCDLTVAECDLIDNTIQSIYADNLNFDGILNESCEIYMRAEAKSIEEHYLRKKSNLNMRDRLKRIIDICVRNNITKEMIIQKKPRRIAKCAGIDEGPIL